MAKYDRVIGALNGVLGDTDKVKVLDKLGVTNAYKSLLEAFSFMKENDIDLETEAGDIGKGLDTKLVGVINKAFEDYEDDDSSSDDDNIKAFEKSIKRNSDFLTLATYYLTISDVLKIKVSEFESDAEKHEKCQKLLVSMSTYAEILELNALVANKKIYNSIKVNLMKLKENLENSVGTLSEDIIDKFNAAQTAINTVSDNVKDTNNKIVELTKKVDNINALSKEDGEALANAIKGEVNKLTAEETELKTSLSNLGTRVSSVLPVITTLSGDVSYLKEEFNNLKSGSLLKDGNILFSRYKDVIPEVFSDYQKLRNLYVANKSTIKELLELAPSLAKGTKKAYEFYNLHRDSVNHIIDEFNSSFPDKDRIDATVNKAKDAAKVLNSVCEALEGKDLKSIMDTVDSLAAIAATLPTSADLTAYKKKGKKALKVAFGLLSAGLLFGAGSVGTSIYNTVINKKTVENTDLSYKKDVADLCANGLYNYASNLGDYENQYFTFEKDDANLNKIILTEEGKSFLAERLKLSEYNFDDETFLNFLADSYYSLVQSSKTEDKTSVDYSVIALNIANYLFENRGDADSPNYQINEADSKLTITDAGKEALKDQGYDVENKVLIDFASSQLLNKLQAEKVVNNSNSAKFYLYAPEVANYLFNNNSDDNLYYTLDGDAFEITEAGKNAISKEYKDIQFNFSDETFLNLVKNNIDTYIKFTQDIEDLQKQNSGLQDEIKNITRVSIAVSNEDSAFMCTVKDEDGKDVKSISKDETLNLVITVSNIDGYHIMPTNANGEIIGKFSISYRDANNTKADYKITSSTIDESGNYIFEVELKYPNNNLNNDDLKKGLVINTGVESVNEGVKGTQVSYANHLTIEIGEDGAISDDYYGYMTDSSFDEKQNLILGTFKNSNKYSQFYSENSPVINILLYENEDDDEPAKNFSVYAEGHNEVVGDDAVWVYDLDENGAFIFNEITPNSLVKSDNTPYAKIVVSLGEEPTANTYKVTYNGEEIEMEHGAETEIYSKLEEGATASDMNIVLIGTDNEIKAKYSYDDAEFDDENSQYKFSIQAYEDDLLVVSMTNEQIAGHNSFSVGCAGSISTEDEENIPVVEFSDVEAQITEDGKIEVPGFKYVTTDEGTDIYKNATFKAYCEFDEAHSKEIDLNPLKDEDGQFMVDEYGYIQFESIALSDIYDGSIRSYMNNITVYVDSVENNTVQVNISDALNEHISFADNKEINVPVGSSNEITFTLDEGYKLGEDAKVVLYGTKENKLPSGEIVKTINEEDVVTLDITSYDEDNNIYTFTINDNGIIDGRYIVVEGVQEVNVEEQESDEEPESEGVQSTSVSGTTTNATNEDGRTGGQRGRGRSGGDEFTK